MIPFSRGGSKERIPGNGGLRFLISFEMGETLEVVVRRERGRTISSIVHYRTSLEEFAFLVCQFQNVL